jgi:uncharacterized membrane protein required for colicin V production
MLDLAVIAILVVFGVMGLISGALFQILRLGAVVAAVAIALAATGPAIEALPFLSQLPAGGEGFVPAGVFLIAYFLLSLVCRLIVKAAHAASPTRGCGDRLLGGVLGALKGAVLCYFIVAILLAAEVSVGKSLRTVDTRDSVAAGLVREWPIGRLKELMDKAESDVLPAVREVLQLPPAEPAEPAPPADVEP